MDVILVPGLWLDGSSWQDVSAGLASAGHMPHPLTLPGMESRNTDRSAITLSDQVGAVVAEIDSIADDVPVALVGHSAGAGVAYGGLDSRVGRIVRAIYVGGFPTGEGDPVAGGFAVEGGDLPMPDWSEFDEADLADLDEEGLEVFHERAIPSPARLTSDPQRLSDERRYQVPVTVICTEFRSSMLREWISQDLTPVRELTKIRDLTYVELPTGHWPQFTRPEDLAEAIVAALRQ